MQSLKIITIALMSVLLASCASVSSAPEPQSTAAKQFQTAEDKGSVYLYRTGRAVGAAVQLTVRVNGVVAGGTGPGSFFKWDLAPGVYTFNSSTEEASATIQLDVKAGQNYFVRQDARLGLGAGRVSMVEVPASQGMSEVQNCKLLVSAYVPD